MPSRAVVTTPYLAGLGVSSQLVRKYIQSGWLIRLGAGAFARAGEEPDWMGGLYALQAQLGLSVHVGGVTALELQGQAHFVPFGTSRPVTLISDGKEFLPKWFSSRNWSVSINHRCLKLFRAVPDSATEPFDCGGFSVQVSSPERAMLEELHLVRSNSDVEHALLLMEGLATLRPHLVQELLEQCSSIKAKRLFLWVAGRSGHRWLESLELSRVDLGTGKRRIYQGGVLDPTYLITVPEAEALPDV
jgi:hypothetical protein